MKMNKFIAIRSFVATIFISIIVLMNYYDVFFPGMYCEGFGCLGYGLFLNIFLPLAFLLVLLVFDFVKYKENRLKHLGTTFIIFLVAYLIGSILQPHLNAKEIRYNILNDYIVSKEEFCDRADIWDSEDQRNSFCNDLRQKIGNDSAVWSVLCKEGVESYFCNNYKNFNSDKKILDDSLNKNDFSCPEEKYINCEPHLSGEWKEKCDGEYGLWIKENCDIRFVY